MADTERTPLIPPVTAGLTSQILSETKVYPLIHLIRCDVLAHIDTPLTYDQLLAPDSTYTIIRPLTDKYLELENQATVFCLLLNKVQFERESTQISISTLSLSRATLCEILAIRVLRGWSERTLPLANVLLTPWAMFQGASEEVIERAKEEGDKELLTQGGTALEMAIISGSKRFIRSPSCQKVIEGIWSGRIIYSALNARALIADNYKRKPIQMYNPHRAPLLDHYRLKVPKIRSVLEYTNFLILFILYVVAMEGLEDDRLNKREMAFVIYALAFSLDKLAAIREHGLKVFSSSLVNGFDLIFMIVYFVYVGARTYGFRYDNPEALALGADWLAIGAVLIFPRLAFVTLANNLLVLSLRSMMTEFFFLMGVGFFCFLGFLYALFTLGEGRFALSQIGWWLLEVYFGLDASGFESAHLFHPFLGPALMVVYALLSNTLLLTVLVAILGNTFATINADAAAESMFRKAVSTLEGVKADAVFSYQLPFNLVAVVFMWPMSYILNPRWFHKLNVLMIRGSNFPVLLVIALYERQKYRETSLMEQFGDFAEKYVGTLPRRIKSAAGFENFGARQDIGAVFEIEREVGSFYKDWDQDALEDDLEFLDRPEAEAAEVDGDDQSGMDEELAETSQDDKPIASFTHSAPTPYTASPRDMRFNIPPRPRRTSMPGHQQHQAVDHANLPSPARAIAPLHRPRRNSSIHEPSPLARLFIRSPDKSSFAERMRDRRQSMVAALHMPTSSSQPILSSVLSPIRKHVRSGSGGTAEIQERYRKTHMSKPSVTPIEERSLPSSPTVDGVPLPVLASIPSEAVTEERANGRSRLQWVIPIRGKEEGREDMENEYQKSKEEVDKKPELESEPDVMPKPAQAVSIVKASQIKEAVLGTSLPKDIDFGVRGRLDRIDERQKRIEEMLQRLLKERDT